MFDELAAYAASIQSDLNRIDDVRSAQLEEVAHFVTERCHAGSTASLVFICTHNSRRSHMSQIWAQTAAHHFGVPHVETFSGGTEATAFNPRAVAALERAGFRISASGKEPNPVYGVRFAEGMDPMKCFSKIYDQPPNPNRSFCAVMTCSQADAGCPLVAGATERIAVPYDDPKAFDGTDQESAKYDECCQQICREMLYVFSRVDF